MKLGIKKIGNCWMEKKNEIDLNKGNLNVKKGNLWPCESIAKIK